MPNNLEHNPADKLPYLIVGQGIAGSLLAWYLEKANQPFLIIDNDHKNAASKIAAGIINPITGRRFVKSWRIEEFLPFAKQTYQEIEQTFGIRLWSNMEIIRFFANNAEGNNWLAKTTWEGYEKYLNPTKKADYLQEKIFDEAGFGTVNGAKVDIGLFISTLKKYFNKKKLILTEQFDYQALEFLDTNISYKGFMAKKVIFCEGYSVQHNPWFTHLPYEHAKGEALIIRIPNFKTPDIIKKHFFLVPLAVDLFWFGSNYEWDDLSEEPTIKGKAYLIEALKGILKIEYEIIDHIAGVRPVLKDRRPILGLHPEFSQIGIFNGLGTKGTSIAPFWAKRLSQFLLENKPIDEEVNSQRFQLTFT